MNDSDTNLRQIEASLHRELMNVCRKYLQQLDIVSVVGMLELVKKESLELESATKNEVKSDINESMF